MIFQGGEKLHQQKIGMGQFQKQPIHTGIKAQKMSSQLEKILQLKEYYFFCSNLAQLRSEIYSKSKNFFKYKIF